MASNQPSVISKLDPEKPDESRLEEAVRLLKAGKTVIFPTETVYGIGAALSQKKAIEAIYNLKGRSEQKPLSFHIAQIDSFDLHNVLFERVICFLINRFWPGPLTLVVRSKNQETLGYRFPSNWIARKLIQMLGEPIMATSANQSDQPPAVTVLEAEKYFGDSVPLYIDGGKTNYKEASTVLDCTVYPPKILREGKDASKVKKALEEFQAMETVKKSILLVCTGNTCRSPMAEGWLKHYLNLKGVSDSFQVQSCGTSAFSGIPPSQEAIDVLKGEGVDISENRSRPIHDELILRSDYIFVMTPVHKNYILERFPEVEERIAVLDVPDPIGMDKSEYQRVYEILKQRLTKELEWILNY